MGATYTWDVFCTVDGYGSYGPEGDWGGYWGKQGPELLERRMALYEPDQRLIVGGNTFREFVEMLGSGPAAVDLDPWNRRMRNLPTTVISSTLRGPFDWPDAEVARGDASEVVARLKSDSRVPLRSHGSLSLNRSLMAAGLVDIVQVTFFPVVSGRTGSRPVFEGAADFDLELVETRTFDGLTIESTYRPHLHR